MGSAAWAAPQAPMLSTWAAIFIMLLISSCAASPALGTHVNGHHEAEALDGSAALPLDSSGGVARWHEKTKSTQALGRKSLQFFFECPNGLDQCPSGIQECFQTASQSCNDWNDCSDGSDEDANYCANVFTHCLYPYGKCPSNKCSNQSVFNGKLYGTDIFWCDRKTDCFDQSDEDPSFCASYDCASQGAVRCPGATPQCMPRVSTLAYDVPGHELRNPYGGFFGPIPEGVASAMCDGVKDCEDGSDEDAAQCFQTPPPIPSGPPPPPEGDGEMAKPSGEGICGGSIAKDFPVRCDFNDSNSYICCDSAGCGGFDPPDYVSPRCKSGVNVPDFVTRTTIFPKDVPCPFVDGFASNSCFDTAGAYHVCCANPDSCASFGPSGEPHCTNDNHVFYYP